VIEAAGATLHYLPAYSPDLNPSEQAFSKRKGDIVFMDNCRPCHPALPDGANSR
jgi:transposase